MLKKWFVLTGVVLLLAAAVLAGARPALAGGWSVITLDAWPGEVPAGEAVEVRFVVRAHGVSPMAGLRPVAYLAHPDSGEVLSLPARELGEEGLYSLDLALPRIGRWEWSIGYAGSEEWAQSMPPLTAVRAVAAAAPAPSGVGERLRAAGVVLGAGLLLGGAFVFARSRDRRAAIPALAGLLLVAVFAPGLLVQPALAAETGVAAQPQAGEISPAELGALLFQAKGCVVCHAHAEGRLGYTGIMTEMGPDLSDTKTKLPPEYLMSWLKDPAAIKPATLMPNLDLDQEEIEALAAFLTQ